MRATSPFNAAAWFAECIAAPTSDALVSDPVVPYGGPDRKRNAVVEETFELASRVMDFSERLIKVNEVFADQVLRSGTSVGSHTREAQSAESLSDFLHKMKIAHKELEETDYRLDLCHLKDHYPRDPELVRCTKALIPLFHSILTTTRTRLNAQLEERRSKRGKR